MARRKSLCWCKTAPIEVVNAINKEIARETRFRDIAAMVGGSPSKSAIHSHSVQCMNRKLLAEYKEKQLDTRDARFVTRWPSGELTLQAQDDSHKGGESISPADLRETDLVFEVSFESAPARPSKVQPEIKTDPTFN